MGVHEKDHKENDGENVDGNCFSCGKCARAAASAIRVVSGLCRVPRKELGLAVELAVDACMSKADYKRRRHVQDDKCLNHDRPVWLLCETDTEELCA